MIAEWKVKRDLPGARSKRSFTAYVQVKYPSREVAPSLGPPDGGRILRECLFAVVLPDISDLGGISPLVGSVERIEDADKYWQ